MAFILSNLFDNYGLPVGIDWKISILIIVLGLLNIYSQLNHNDDYSGLNFVATIFIHISCLVYLSSFVFMYALNPYDYIPSSGTEKQKAVLEKCTEGKSITRENIKDIMIDCKTRNRNLRYESNH